MLALARGGRKERTVSEPIALTLFREGVTAARSGDKPRARQLLLEATENDPHNESLWLWLAGVAERPQDAVAHLERVLVINPASDRAREGLKSARLQAGVAEARAGNLPLARRYLRSAVEGDPTNELARLWLASVADSPSEAAEHYERVLVLNPGNDKARANLAAAYLNAANLELQEGNSSAARTQLLALTRHAPEREDAWMLLAEIAEGPEEAIGYLERVLALAPQHERAREQLAAKQALLVPAWECPLCRATDREPAPNAPCPRCGAALSLADPEAVLRNAVSDAPALRRAIAEMEAALAKGEDFALHYWLGLAHANLKHTAEALRHFQAALALRSDRALRAQVNRLLQLHQAAAAAHDEPVHRGIVLVVDDSNTVRQVVRTTLEAAAYEVRTAADGQEAIRSIREAGLPDLVLLDISMPNMDGYQLCKLLKSTSGARHVPIIIMSGKDGFFDKVRGRWAGATVYLTKPFKATTLVAEVEKYCRPRRGASA
jgi:twitching motility two-component system response regulator PilG